MAVSIAGSQQDSRCFDMFNNFAVLLSFNWNIASPGHYTSVISKPQWFRHTIPRILNIIVILSLKVYVTMHVACLSVNKRNTSDTRQLDVSVLMAKKGATGISLVLEMTLKNKI